MSDRKTWRHGESGECRRKEVKSPEESIRGVSKRGEMRRSSGNESATKVQRCEGSPARAKGRKVQPARRTLTHVSSSPTSKLGRCTERCPGTESRRYISSRRRPAHTLSYLSREEGEERPRARTFGPVRFEIPRREDTEQPITPSLLYAPFPFFNQPFSLDYSPLEEQPNPVARRHSTWLR